MPRVVRPKRSGARRDWHERFAQLCRGWLPSEPKTRAVAAIFVVGACIVAGSLIVPFDAPKRTTPKAPPPLTEMRTFQWGPADRPTQVVPSSDGAVWIADDRRAVVYRLSENGTTRQYPLRGLEDPPASWHASAVAEIASDRSGNVWVLAYPDPLEASQVLIGLTPGGRELARYRLPVSGSPAIDRAGRAWMTDFRGPDTGVVVRSISLRSGAVRKYSAFTGIKLAMSRIKIDARGNALLLGEPDTGRGDVNLVMARLTRDGVVSRPVHWPKRLSYPLGAAFTADRHGDVWLGYLGGMARIDARGDVAAFPLFPKVQVLFVEAGPDGHIVFNALGAPRFPGLAPPTFIGGSTPSTRRSCRPSSKSRPCAADPGTSG